MNYSDINQTFIIEPLSITGGSPTLSACTAFYTNSIEGCDNDTVISINENEVSFNNSITPNIDSTIDIGTPIKRFRTINLVSGSTSFWSSSVSINTPTLNLGFDNQGNYREITANNSIIQNDLLNGGLY